MVYVFMEYAKNLDFKMEIDSKVPSVLYGDSILFRIGYWYRYQKKRVFHFCSVHSREWMRQKTDI